MLPLDVINAIRHLLNRVDLKGSEVPVFIRIHEHLNVEETAIKSAPQTAETTSATLNG